MSKPLLKNFIPEFAGSRMKTAFKNSSALPAALGAPAVRQLYALFIFCFKNLPHPNAKMIIFGALVYFLAPY